MREQISGNARIGHVGAILELEELANVAGANSVSNSCVELWTEARLCRVQSLITKDQHKIGAPKLEEKCIGKLRDVDIMIRANPGLSHTLVKYQLGELIQEIDRWQFRSRELSLRENIIAIAKFHWIFERIHPFADGNGRTGRALALSMIIFAGIKPLIFTHIDKFESYYPCFVSDTPDMMSNYFLRRCGQEPLIL